MDENVLEDSQLESTDSLESAESLSDDTEHSENDMESIFDSAVDSSGNDDTELEESIEDIGLSDLYDTETGGIPVYVVHSDDDTEEKLMDDELGGVPVVLTNDVSPIASYASNDGVSYQLPAYYIDYYRGVLSNLGDTDYLCFCSREFPYNNDYWVEHYRLVYDLDIDSDSVVQGNYPCIDIYRYSSSSSYNVDYTTYNLTSVPAFSYGSFGKYSDLRQGVTPNESMAFLFFLGFAVVFSVLRSFFRCCVGLRRR